MKGMSLEYGLLYGFFAVLALGGLAVFFITLVWPVMDLVAARSWVEIPCAITSTSIESSDSSDGTTYQAVIRYSFELDGDRYEGNRHNFSPFSGSKDVARQLLQQYPVGHEITCWVDPEDPSQSVLDRGPNKYLLLSLISFPLMAIGFGGIWFLLAN